MTDREVLELCKTWFSGIMDKCDRLTSGNVSHQKAVIRTTAKECINFIDTHLNKSFSEKLTEYFENTPKEQLNEEWDKIKHLNDIGPDVIEYYKHYKKIFENGTLDSKR